MFNRTEEAEVSESGAAVFWLSKELISVLPEMRLLKDNREDVLFVFAPSSNSDERVPLVISEFKLIKELAVTVFERSVPVFDEFFAPSLSAALFDCPCSDV